MKKLLTLLTLCVSMLFLGACTAKSSTTFVLDETEVAISQATPATIVPVSLEPPVDNCVVCHTDKQMLIDSANITEEGQGNGVEVVDAHGSMAPMEPWEKVLVSEEFFINVHGQTTCAACHAGDSSSTDKETAHTGLIAAPDADPQRTCGNCHSEIVTTSADSLHVSQNGFYQAIYSRSLPENHAALDEMFSDNCQSCHTTCGDCHIAQPDIVGGGLLAGHEIVKTPPMSLTCIACHDSRVGNEYMGKNDELPGDLHFRLLLMTCVNCHDGASMHDSEGNNHRYEGSQSPSCESCHDEVGNTSDSVVQHQIHQDTLSCQVCHSVSYTNCESCHIDVDESTGNANHTLDSTYLTFLIGRNSRQSSDRPYEYVPVRHIPIDPESFADYGNNLLPNYNLLPTWTYATPHNIQRNTPQNESCNSCHGNADIFLTADKIQKGELTANRNVIVENVPGLIPEQ